MKSLSQISKGSAAAPITAPSGLVVSNGAGVQTAAVSGTDVKTLNGQPLLGAGDVTSIRNRIINGDMRIDQRNKGVAVTPAASSYTVDRFQFQTNVASKLTFQQVADAPAGLAFSTKITVAAQYAPAAGDYLLFGTTLEGQDTVDFQLGLSTAKQITASLAVKGSVAGTYGIRLTNSASGRTYVGLITVTNTWAVQSVTLVADTSGTWPKDSSAGLSLQIDLGSGASFNTTAGVWSASGQSRTSACVTFVNQTAGATLNITGVQLDLGAVANFEIRPYRTELEWCQRYFERFSYAASQVGPSGGYAQSATVAYLTFPTSPKRSTPSVTATGPLQLFTSGSATTNATVTGVYGAADRSGTTLQLATTGLTANQSTQLYANAGPVTVDFNSEL